MLAARETKMLSAERMERMIDAPTNDEAAKILEECGYGDLSGLSAKEAGAALEAHIAALFDEVEGMVPEAQLVQLFRLKYDYHNAKALIKARAMGVECDAILSQRGTVAPQKLLTAFLEEDYRDIPPILAQAMVSAAAILARTTNPQAADFELDRAYFAQMLALSDGLSDGGFARGYVQLQIDSANLRAAVRTRRMAKDADFLKTALIPGGTIGTDRVLAAFDSAEALTALYGNTWLGNAAASERLVCARTRASASRTSWLLMGGSSFSRGTFSQVPSAVSWRAFTLSASWRFTKVVTSARQVGSSTG